MSAQIAQPSETKQLLALLAQLATLTDAVTRLREAQDRGGQAQAAREAAQGLRVATAHYGGSSTFPVGAGAIPPASKVGSRAAPPSQPFQLGSDRSGPKVPRGPRR